MSFVIVFDIPKSQAVEKVRINRELNRAGAQLLQDSFWRLDNLKELIKIASHIRKIGGKASILEEKLIF